MRYDLQNVTDNRGMNAGGICKIEFVPKDWIAAHFAPSAADGAVHGKPTLIAGKSWLTGKMERNGTSFDEDGKLADAGDYAEQTINGSINKDILATNNLMNTLRYYEYVVIIYGKNGNNRIVGNKSSGMLFSSKYTSGATYADKEVYRLSFTHVMAENAPLLVV